MNLIRQEVLDAQISKSYGEVRSVLPPRIEYPVIATLTLCIFCFGMGLFIKFENRVEISGYLGNDHGVYDIVSDRYGIVSNIVSKNGQEVQKGEVIASILKDNLNEHNSFLKKSLQSLQRQKQRLIQTKINDEKSYQIKKSIDLELKKSLESEIDQTTEEYNETKKYISKQLKRLDKSKKLFDEHLIRIQQVESIEDRIDNLRSRISKLSLKIISLKKDLSIHRMNISKNVINHNNNVLDNDRKISELNQKINDKNNINSRDYTSPVDGTLNAINIQSGQMVKPGQKILTILPNVGELQAEFFVRTENLGFIEVGQKVYIEYETFPSQKYGVHVGEVTSIGNAPVKSMISETVSGTDLYYRVIVKLPQQYFELPEKFMLKYGMRIKGRFPSDKESFYSLLFNHKI